jgi:hypothetical protein
LSEQAFLTISLTGEAIKGVLAHNVFSLKCTIDAGDGDENGVANV